MSDTYPVVYGDAGDGRAMHSLSIEPGDLIVVATECPGRRMRGGIGGQAFTACSFCGGMMPSTAGPHPKDGWMLTPVVVTFANETHVEWRPLHVVDHEAR